MLHNFLTNRQPLDKIKTIKSFVGAAPSLRNKQDAERGVFVLGLFVVAYGHTPLKPECPANREAWGGSYEPLITLGLFYSPKNQNNRRRGAMCISKREIRPGIGGGDDILYNTYKNKS